MRRWLYASQHFIGVRGKSNPYRIPAHPTHAHRQQDHDGAGHRGDVTGSPFDPSSRTAGKGGQLKPYARVAALAALVVVLGAPGCGPDQAAELLDAASTELNSARAISTGVGAQLRTSGFETTSGQLETAQADLSAATTKLDQAAQQSPTAAESERVQTLTANADGVDSTVSSEQDAVQQAAALPATQDQSRVTKYIYGKATSKVCQVIANTIAGQRPTLLEVEQQVTSEVEQELTEYVSRAYVTTVSTAYVTTIAHSVASVVAGQLSRIQALINANPTSFTEDLEAARAYYNC